MKTRYVVCVKPPDDHPSVVRTFGTWQHRDRADEFCDKVRAAVEKAEQTSGDPVDMITGYAYVMHIESPRLRPAISWATRGER